MAHPNFTVTKMGRISEDALRLAPSVFRSGCNGQVVVLGRLIVSGNAAATAANILGHEQLYRLGFATSVVAVAFHFAWAFLMFDLLKVVNMRLALYATFITLIGCAMQAVTSLLYIAPLVLLQGGSSLSAFTTEQLQALAAAILKLNAHASTSTRRSSDFGAF